MSIAALVKQWQEGLVGEAEFVSRLNKLDLALFAHGKLLHWESTLGGWNVVDSKRIVPDIVDAYMPAPGCLSLGVRFVENNHLPKGVDAVLTSGQNAVALVNEDNKNEK